MRYLLGLVGFLGVMGLLVGWHTATKNGSFLPKEVFVSEEISEEENSEESSLGWFTELYVKESGDIALMNPEKVQQFLAAHGAGTLKTASGKEDPIMTEEEYKAAVNRSLQRVNGSEVAAALALENKEEQKAALQKIGDKAAHNADFLHNQAVPPALSQLHSRYAATAIAFRDAVGQMIRGGRGDQMGVLLAADRIDDLEPHLEVIRAAGIAGFYQPTDNATLLASVYNWPVDRQQEASVAGIQDVVEEKPSALCGFCVSLDDMLKQVNIASL